MTKNLKIHEAHQVWSLNLLFDHLITKALNFSSTSIWLNLINLIHSAEIFIIQILIVKLRIEN